MTSLANHVLFAVGLSGCVAGSLESEPKESVIESAPGGETAESTPPADSGGPDSPTDDTASPHDSGSTDDSVAPDDSADPVPSEDDTGDSPDACDGDLPGVTDTKFCGDVEQQLAGWDLSYGGGTADEAVLFAAGDYLQLPGTYAEYVYVWYTPTEGSWLSSAVRIGGVESDETEGFGYSAEVGADLNGDGYNDLAAGAFAADLSSGRNNAGSVLYFSGPFNEGRASTDAEASIDGAGSDQFFGEFLDVLQDSDSDGYDELIASTGWDTGKGYVILANCPIVSMKYSEADTVFRNSDGLPASSLAVGDVDGDGVEDVLIGDVENSSKGKGAVFIAQSSDRGEVTLTDGVGVYAPAGSFARGYTAQAGDVTGDGYGDLLVDYRDTTGTWTLAAMVGPITSDQTVDTAIATYTWTESDNRIRRAVVAGDLDADGQSGDVVIGDTLTRTLYFAPAPLSGAYTLDADLAFVTDDATGSGLGYTFEALPDVTDDGIDDLLVAAAGDSEGNTYAGAVYTLWGGSW